MNKIKKAISLQADMLALFVKINAAQENIDLLNLAVNVLREKAERENPKPLTLEELQELIDSDEEDIAIWIKFIDDDNYFIRALLDWDGERGIFAIWHSGKNTADFPIEKNYGKTWLAYRTKPVLREE